MIWHIMTLILAWSLGVYKMGPCQMTFLSVSLSFVYHLCKNRGIPRNIFKYIMSYKRRSHVMTTIAHCKSFYISLLLSNINISCGLFCFVELLSSKVKYTVCCMIYYMSYVDGCYSELFSDYLYRRFIFVISAFLGSGWVNFLVCDCFTFSI